MAHVEWKLQTLDQSVQPAMSADWEFPSKEAALLAASDVIAHQRLIKVIAVENADQRMDLADIEKWCRNRASQKA
jgi:hypothetical protein